jgi:carbohydrate-selective porin OprB
VPRSDVQAAPWRLRRVLLRGLLPAALSALTLAAQPSHAVADDWLHGDDATGTWGGLRGELEDKGVHVDLDYVAETFTRDLKAIAYRGSVDFTFEFDTEKAGLWKGGEMLAFAQQAHGDGVSDDIGLAMPASNYEALAFTQLSELWLYQELPHGLALRLGKQDGNRDFAAPRFGGNFLNSSYGVLPNTPLPSYPAPAMGAALFLSASDTVGFRAGVYEGSPEAGSFAGNAFDRGSGTFVIAAAHYEEGTDQAHDTRAQIGGWHHTALDRSGLFGVADHMFRFAPGSAEDRRSVQVFLRGSWDPDAHGTDPDLHFGVGLTAHGFAGANNTVGLGAGFVSIAEDEQGFLELFFKWRPVPWFTVQPDAQIHFVGDDAHVLIGLRCKVKL